MSAPANRQVDVLIIGAGLAGLSCGLYCQRPFLICEQAREPGGLCVTVENDSFLFDCGAHVLHFRTPEARRLITDWLGVPLNTFSRRAFVSVRDRVVPYPFQYHLHGLDPAVVQECLLGLEQARRDPLEALYYAGDNLENWLLKNFGRGLCRHFLLPFNRKFWRMPLRGLTSEWGRRAVPVPTTEQVFQGALDPKARPYGYNATFEYPASGGIGIIAQKMARLMPGRVEYGRRLDRIDYRRRTAHFADGETIAYHTLITTSPMADLRFQLGPVPDLIGQSLGALKSVSILNVNLGVKTPHRPQFHWMYFPQSGPPYFRLGYPTTFAPYAAPAGRDTIYTETSCRIGPGDEEPKGLERKVLRDVTTRYPELDILARRTFFIRHGYVVFDHACQESRERILRFLSDHHIVPCGRYGTWSYLSMEETLLNGMSVARALNTSPVR